jgi:16S rRNA (uracil1498-N3)-methyltransferase
MYRFFINPENITRKFVRFNELQSKQMRKVLRMKIGDKVTGFDGLGSEYTIEVLKLTNSGAEGRITEEVFSQSESNIILYQALPKNLKIDFILQKCTELGIDKIVFFESEFSQVDAKKISESKVIRWRRIASEASEQSHRVFIPEIELSIDGLSEILKELSQNDIPKFYMDKKGDWISNYAKEMSSKSLIFFIGPEGGFSPTEKKHFESYAIKPTKISNNILRSETAGMAVLAQLELIKTSGASKNQI